MTTCKLVPKIEGFMFCPKSFLKLNKLAKRLFLFGCNRCRSFSFLLHMNVCKTKNFKDNKKGN